MINFVITYFSSNVGEIVVGLTFYLTKINSSRMSARSSARKLRNSKEDVVAIKQVIEHGITAACRPKKTFRSIKSRTRKQCNQGPSIQTGTDVGLRETTWTDVEDTTLYDNFVAFGMNWSRYMLLLPNKSENAIRKRYQVICRREFYSSDSDSSGNDAISSSGRKKKSNQNKPTSNQSVVDTIEGETTLDQKYTRLQELLAERSKLDREILELEEGSSLSSDSDFFREGKIVSDCDDLSLDLEWAVANSVIVIKQNPSEL